MCENFSVYDTEIQILKARKDIFFNLVLKYMDCGPGVDHEPPFEGQCYKHMYCQGLTTPLRGDCWDSLGRFFSPNT